jgi:hypothetical protein
LFYLDPKVLMHPVALALQMAAVVAAVAEVS